MKEEERQIQQRYQPSGQKPQVQSRYLQQVNSAPKKTTESKRPTEQLSKVKSMSKQSFMRRKDSVQLTTKESVRPKPQTPQKMLKKES